MRQLVYYVYYASYQEPLYLWWMETLLKNWKGSKCCVQDCCSFFFYLLSTFELIIPVSGNSPIYGKRRIFYPKLPSTKFEILIALIFLNFLSLKSLNNSWGNSNTVFLMLQSVTKYFRLTLVFCEKLNYGKNLIAFFRNFFASINKIFILAGGLGTRLSFYSV